MRLFILLSVFPIMIGCKAIMPQSETSVAVAEPVTAPVEDELPVVTDEPFIALQDGDYIVNGSAHPYDAGDVYEIDGNNYRRAVWEEGVVTIEVGTFEYEHTSLDHRIIFTVTEWIPSSCGYDLQSFDVRYQLRDEKSSNSDLVAIDNDNVNKGYGWNMDVQWAEDNLTQGCL